MEIVLYRDPIQNRKKKIPEDLAEEFVGLRLKVHSVHGPSEDFPAGFYFVKINDYLSALIKDRPRLAEWCYPGLRAFPDVGDAVLFPVSKDYCELIDGAIN